MDGVGNHKTMWGGLNFPKTFTFNAADRLLTMVEGASLTTFGRDPPTPDVTTMVWDGSDYLLLSEPTGSRVVLTLESEIVACGSKDLLTNPLESLGNLKNEVSQRSLKLVSGYETT